MIDEIKERKEGSVHTYKTSLTGNGLAYCWKELDESGIVVRESSQTYNSEADAEKGMRAIASSTDIVEVINIKNINTEANTNVNLVKETAVGENYGMNRVSKSIEDNSVTEPVKVTEHLNVAKMNSPEMVAAEAKRAEAAAKIAEDKADADAKAEKKAEADAKAEEKAKK